jgi:tricorn protease
LGQPVDLDWKVSPDGSRVAVFGGDQPRGHVRIVELETGGERNLQLPHGWSIWNLRWTADGKALLVAAQSKTTGYLIVHIGLDGKSTVLLDRGRNQWLSFPCPSPDGRRLAFSEQTFETNAYLLENF